MRAGQAAAPAGAQSAPSELDHSSLWTAPPTSRPPVSHSRSRKNACAPLIRSPQSAFGVALQTSASSDDHAARWPVIHSRPSAAATGISAIGQVPGAHSAWNRPLPRGAASSHR